uniref:Uncharacterized protein n=1 Tax=Setaria viridis TaxID=4556 RepID=A0A4U6VMN2_SETVI|nr:hypothetical protein SEVIR_2G075000v2 [Setaria viridis]
MISYQVQINFNLYNQKVQKAFTLLLQSPELFTRHHQAFKHLWVIEDLKENDLDLGVADTDIWRCTEILQPNISKYVQELHHLIGQQRTSRIELAPPPDRNRIRHSRGRGEERGYLRLVRGEGWCVSAGGVGAAHLLRLFRPACLPSRPLRRVREGGEVARLPHEAAPRAAAFTRQAALPPPGQRRLPSCLLRRWRCSARAAAPGRGRGWPRRAPPLPFVARLDHLAQALPADGDGRAPRERDEHAQHSELERVPAAATERDTGEHRGKIAWIPGRAARGPRRRRRRGGGPRRTRAPAPTPCHAPASDLDPAGAGGAAAESREGRRRQAKRERGREGGGREQGERGRWWGGVEERGREGAAGPGRRGD